MRKVIAIALTAFWIAVVAFVVVVSSQDRRVSSQWSQWPTVQGNITSSETTSGKLPNGETYYRLNTRFRYEVEGTLYYSTQSWYAADQEEERKYPPGTRVTVHYDPLEPQTAVIEPGKVLNEWLAILVQAIGWGIIVSLVSWASIWPHGTSHKQAAKSFSIDTSTTERGEGQCGKPRYKTNVVKKKARLREEARHESKSSQQTG
ncbi:MAG: hypothetical protein A2144_04885 [Chloroflexi bacterium RBG_16_50_9]|nr:MAG: hypothetical protein A2144_04885 [Chloroflexi bacterium RBG_16_50_9]